MRSRLTVLALLVVTAAPVSGCGGTQTSGAQEPTATGSASPSPAAKTEAASPPSSAPSSPRPSATATRPATMVPTPADSAAALARQLTAALATVARGRAGADDVRRAALFEQTTARHLAKVPASRRTDVLGRLSPDARAQLTADISAARELMAMTAPQPKLPSWRILTPARPAELLADYHRAEKQTGTPWAYLAAVNLVESRMGRIRGTSTAGAQGPMQFLPTTFDMYGKGGDINDPGDAILAAGRMLAHNGAPRDMSGALWSYNQSRRYGDAVAIYARQMQRSPHAYQLYWHWQVLYSSTKGTMLLPEGYPGKPAVEIKP